MNSIAAAPFARLEHALHLMKALTVLTACVLIVAGIVAWIFHWRNLAWTWALVPMPLAAPLWLVEQPVSIALALTAALTAAVAGRHAWEDKRAGGDLADTIRHRHGLRDALRAHRASRQAKSGQWVNDDGLWIGVDRRNRPVRVPVGVASGVHTLVVGATGSGKTVSQAWIAGRHIELGHAVICVDPKGDATLLRELVRATERAGRRVHRWAPSSSDCVYNPYGRGSDIEIVDKLLTAETYTEPHYQRQAQRYLGWVVRAIRAAGATPDLAQIVALTQPAELERWGRQLPADDAAPLHAYLDSLTSHQQRDLAGTRDRLAILVESELGRSMKPEAGDRDLDLAEVIARSEVAYFDLESDRWPLAAKMLAASIVQDLINLAAHHTKAPAPVLVLLDEFAALETEQVSSLFARGRSAGFSVLLGSQEWADLEAAEPLLARRVLGNVETLIAHRQSDPESAEHVARVAGTDWTWNRTDQTIDGLRRPGERQMGTRARGNEFRIHPDQIKDLRTGQAAVVSRSRGLAEIVSMHHPRLADRGTR